MRGELGSTPLLSYLLALSDPPAAPSPFFAEGTGLLKALNPFLQRVLLPIESLGGVFNSCALVGSIAFL